LQYLSRERFDRGSWRWTFSIIAGQWARCATLLGVLRGRKRSAQPLHVEREHVERDELAGERLGRRDPDLRARRACRPFRRPRASPSSPTTLQIARVLAPCCFASRSAARVSAVSPDCVTTTCSVLSSTIGWR
jgi:hypothetical protein